MALGDSSIAAWLRERTDESERAKQMAALQLACGIDLEHALRQQGEARERIVKRIRRAMERERMRGRRGLPDYDFDRHVALKRSLDRLGAASRPSNGRRAPAEPQNPAGKRRRPWKQEESRSDKSAGGVAERRSATDFCP